jgi:hypothetical protein
VNRIPDKNRDAAKMTKRIYAAEDGFPFSLSVKKENRSETGKKADSSNTAGFLIKQ